MVRQARATDGGVDTGRRRTARRRRLRPAARSPTRDGVGRRCYAWSVYREALAAAEAEANRTKEESRRVIEAERESARSELKGQVDQLSNKIIDRLLAA